MADLLESIKQHLAAYSASNWDAYKDGFTKDVVYEEMATKIRVQGVDKYVDAVQRWKRAFPDLKATFINGFVSGDKAVVEVMWEGTHTGPFDGPLGAIAPTNQRGRVNGVLVMTLKDGKIAESRHYFDLLTVLSQIGVVPMIGASGQPQATTGAAPASPRH
jgi:steroid delta-isomerase-like uncharacterized protein